MKVSLGGYVLAGGDNERLHTSAFNIRISGTRATQSRDGVRRERSGVRDRKNLANTLSFSTVRYFATAALAEAFAETYDTTAPYTGTLTTSNGSSMLDTVVLPPDREVNGCSVTLHYTCIGSGLE